MQKKLSEELVIFASVIKWTILATAVGGMVGFSTTVFIKLLGGSIGYMSQYSYYFLLMPAAFIISLVLVRIFAPEAEGHGTEKIIEAVHRHSGKIPLSVVPVKLAATIITIAGGGSAGKEGPAAQIGAALASGLARLLRFDAKDRKKLVICGISAGFAAIFGTPVGGAIFGVEVLFAGAMLYEVLLPSFIAGIISYHVASMLGLTYFSRPFESVPAFNEFFFLQVIFAGICFGLVSMIFIEVMTYTGKVSKKVSTPSILRPLIGGCVLAALTFLVSRDYLGLGIETIESALNGTEILWYACFLKIFYTSITLGFGGSGGVVTPIFFIGATAGNAFGHLFGLDPAMFSAIGFVSLLAGCANTPISASIISIELFGPHLAPYAAVACIISFLMTGHRSVYPSQVLSARKSASIEVQLGQELVSTIADAHPWEKLSGLAAKMVQSVRKLFQSKSK